jgi:glycosyltransferase involved in cell wall biosynthesis
MFRSTPAPEERGLPARPLGQRRPRVLILTPRYPYPVIGGDRLRIHRLCRVLAGSFSLTLLSLCDDRRELDHVPDDDVFSRIERIYLPRWRSYANALAAVPTATPLQVAYYRCAAFRNRLEALLPEHDATLAHLIRTGQYIEGSDRPAFLEMTDAISLNYARVRSSRARLGLKGWIYALEAGRLKRYEQRMLRRFDAVTLVSAVDRDFLTEGADDPRVLVCSNAIDLGRMAWQAPGREPILVFIGNMLSMQNMDACVHFATDVLPLLRRRNPSLRFRVVGRISARGTASLRGIEGVDVTGEVDDVGAAAAGAMAGICSVRLGAGIQNKVLEYMALGLPVVTTTVGAEGLHATPDEHMLVADTPAAFEHAVGRLLSDPALGAGLSVRARRFVEARSDWDRQLAPLVERMSRVIEACAGTDAATASAPESMRVADAARRASTAARGTALARSAEAVEP